MYGGHPLRHKHVYYHKVTTLMPATDVAYFGWLRSQLIAGPRWRRCPANLFLGIQLKFWITPHWQPWTWI